jgi:prepilin-type N-terminal cleavage/methylation domain-containing protein
MSRGARGFALLELIVALAILGAGFSVLFTSLSASARNIGRLQTFQRRRELVENLLAELELVQGLRAGDEARGVFTDGTRWSIDVRPFARTLQNPDGLVRILLRVEWDGRSGPQVRTIETYRLERKQAPARSLQDQLRDLQ